MRQISKLALIIGLILALAGMGQAATVDELQAQINQRNEQIKALQAEIAGYQKSLDATAKQSDTLSGELSIINTTIKKLDADIKLTQAKIGAAEDTIQKLGLEIGKKDTSISENQNSLGESLRLLQTSQETNLVEQIAGKTNLTDFWTDEEHLLNLEKQVIDQVKTLRALRAGLSDKKAATESEKKKLTALQAQLADQKKIAAANQQSKNQLLAQTKNQEANYKKLVADRQAKVAAFQQELFQFESQLKTKVDKSNLPHSGSGVLNWPLTDIFVTQYFGKTVAAARLYLSGSHNGVDFRASVGTPVLAAGDGLVVGTGDTDPACPGASYGKWVFIKHPNGLGTIYGHLSLIKTVEGQSVRVGDVIAYSGKTGYATGPHLHLSVVVASAVSVGTLVSKTCPGATFRIPLTPAQAYLDPMLYL